MKILWLKTGPLYPLNTGGRIRTFNMLRMLKQKHEITYVSLRAESCDPKLIGTASEYSARQVWIPWKETLARSPQFALELAGNQFFSRLPYVIAKYRVRDMAAAIRELDATGQFDLIICDFLTPAVNLFHEGWRPKTPALLFQHNVESRIWQRLHEQAANAAKRIYFRSQWRRMEQFEREMCLRFDGVVGVSEADCDIMREAFGAVNVLGSVPTGVDCEFFRPSDSRRKPASLVFLGSMDWMPNADAADYFVKEIWPRVLQGFPAATLVIVGRNPPPGVKELETQAEGIRVTGTVDDVRPYLAESTAMIVPLRIGSGTRIKIFEGMASGIPVVSTRIGAEGLPVKHGENILIADTPPDFARQIRVLFEQPAQARRIGTNGCALVRERFSWEAVNGVFEAFCVQVCAKQKGRI